MTVPELVPEPLWYRSAYRMLGKRKAWQVIRQDALRQAGYRCAGCGSDKGQLSCHEKWHYDDDRATATLVGFEIHCPLCDLVSHAGRAIRHGFGDSVVQHLCDMNDCTEDEAKRIIAVAMRQWRMRSAKTWRIIVAPAFLEMYPDLEGLPQFQPKAVSK